MAEILTESFCERCGTRYTFESPRQRVRLKGVKVLSRGLKNFVLSDGTSMDEAMAAARSETDREVTAHQLDAFHKTFNFCMACRQYTCPDCWNEVEARCLSCAPHLGHEILAAPFPDLGATIVMAPEVGSNEGLPVDLVPVDLVPADFGSKSAAQTAGLLSRFRPGQSLDAELDAYERDRATDLIDPVAAATGDPATSVRSRPAAETVPVAEAAAASAEETVPTAEAAAASAAETVPTAEAAAASATFQPIHERAASAPTTPAEVAPPLGDIVAQPTWQRVAPDPMSGTPVASPVPAPTSQPASDDTGATAEPAWPAKPEWPTLATPSANLPFLGRPAARQGGPDALWAETAHEMVAPATPVKTIGGVQPCVSCGLSLSATARFCRRCGTSQAG